MHFASLERALTKHSNETELSFEMSQHQRRQQRRQRYQRNAIPINEDPYFDIGRMNTVCTHCGAKRFKNENKSICCANGQVELPPIPDAPDLLKALLMDKEFKDKIRSYNAALAFASLGANEDVLPPGVYSFRVNGDIHHRLGHLLPDAGVPTPKFAQMYIYDTEHEANNRAQHHGGNLDINVIRQLQDLIHRVNPFARVS